MVSLEAAYVAIEEDWSTSSQLQMLSVCEKESDRFTIRLGKRLSDINNHLMRTWNHNHRMLDKEI